MKTKRLIIYLDDYFELGPFLIILLILLMLPGKLIIASSQSHSTQAQSTRQGASDEVLRLEANLVTVPTVVMDRDGRYITDLRREDFQIFEDGVEQEIALFASVEQPFTILFLLDTSGSMTGFMADLARAANTFLGQLRPDDCLIVWSFDQWVEVLCKATKVRDLRKQIRLSQAVGGNSGAITRIYDAVDKAIKNMRKIGGRKAMVLFSDGFGGSFLADAKRNLRYAEESDVLIYTVAFGTFPAEPPRFINRERYFKEIEDANDYMRDLAQRTGGRHYHVDKVSDLGKTFSLVAEELRTQYSLGYYPKKRLEPGQRRQIKVKVRLPELVVRARDSYIVGPSQRSQK